MSIHANGVAQHKQNGKKKKNQKNKRPKSKLKHCIASRCIKKTKTSKFVKKIQHRHFTNFM